MTPALRFEGIYTPVVTPFHDDFSINWGALADVIDRLLDHGVHGLIAGGSTGENYAQTVAERIEIARFMTERAKGRAQIIVGTGAMLTPDSIALAEAARDMGADAILLASPPYAVPTERENALNALAIDKAANLPVMLYNYPGRTGTMMGDEFLDHVPGFTINGVVSSQCDMIHGNCHYSRSCHHNLLPWSLCVRERLGRPSTSLGWSAVFASLCTLFCTVSCLCLPSLGSRVHSSAQPLIHSVASACVALLPYGY